MKTICHNFYRKIIFNASALCINYKNFLHQKSLFFASKMLKCRHKIIAYIL